MPDETYISSIPASILPEAPAKKTYFTVLKFPRSSLHDVREGEPFICHNHYFMRTAGTIDEAVELAQKEFLDHQFPDGRFNPRYLTGELNFAGKEIVVGPNLGEVKGFNFWIAEGLVGLFYKDTPDPQFPKIKTDRQPTKKLYKLDLSITHPALSEQVLTTLLTDPQNTSSIALAPLYVISGDAWRQAKGRPKSKIAIMNYGYLQKEYCTHFADPDTHIWYQLLNKHTIPKDTNKLNIITLGEEHGFRESDKVQETRKNLFFDGSMMDVFRMLLDSGKGIKIQDGIFKD